MSLLHKPKFRFRMKNGHWPTLYGYSEKEALMGHLIVATKRVGHPISLEEAKNIDSDLILVEPTEYLRWFDSFDQAAETAWDSIFVPKEPEKFVFKLNNEDSIPIEGTSEKEALMSHLIEKTNEVDHQISFKEAKNSDFVVMIKPSEFVLPFGSFDKAARKAWECACSADKES